tara:strand:- start:13360 stop:13593 length:234 start_codon:yes stop_codon:yes gene_type:complete
MFNIGWAELILLIVISIFFIKPEDYFSFLKNIFKFFYKTKNYFSSFFDEINEEIQIDEFKETNKTILKIQKKLKKKK